MTRKRLLFVDDEPHALAALRRMLRDEQGHWDMHFVRTAEEALQHAASDSLDAMVLDIKLGGTDGLELLQQLRRNPATRDVPVVFLTGLCERGLKRRALELGAADLLPKPVEPEDLRARIRNVLRLKAYEDQLKTLNDDLQRQVEQRTAQLEESRFDIIWRLAKAGEYRDEQTGNHIVRVGCYCRVVAERLGSPREFVERVFLTSPLHDIGKIGVPDRILLKPGKLTPEEREQMQRHCEIGSRILMEPPRGMRPFLAWRGQPAGARAAQNPNPILATAVSIAIAHHERWDGGGYPRGLAGERIPLEARITALADVYDALGSPRPYKPALPDDQVLRIIRQEGEGHFGPDVFAAFVGAVGEFRSIRAQFPDDSQAADEEGGGG
ncbi:MAG: HD-GYP domain-containing protein [Candidatus Brocadiia bacterium]